MSTEYRYTIDLESDNKAELERAIAELKKRTKDEGYSSFLEIVPPQEGWTWSDNNCYDCEWIESQKMYGASRMGVMLEGIKEFSKLFKDVLFTFNMDVNLEHPGCCEIIQNGETLFKVISNCEYDDGLMPLDVDGDCSTQIVNDVDACVDKADLSLVLGDVME